MQRSNPRSELRSAFLSRVRGAAVHLYRRNPLLTYGILALTALLLILVTLAPLASALVDGWSRRDVDLRSRLVFRSIRNQVSSGLAATPVIDPVPFFEQLAGDERLIALGFCDQTGSLVYTTREMPEGISCKQLPVAKSDTFAARSTPAGRVHIGIFPISAGPASGHLLIVHDLAFVDARAAKARKYVILALLGIVSGFGLLASALVLALMRGWARSLREAIGQAAAKGDMDTGTALALPPAPGFPMAREMQALLSELRIERKYAEGIHVEWSPKTLHRLLVEELPGTQVLIVSNREPYIHNHGENGEVRVQIPASGLVAALEPVMRACGGTWIAHGSGTADPDTVDADDRVAVPPGDPAYTLRRVWLTDEEQDGYYYGLANEGLWPLCHIAFVRPTFRAEDWAQYVAINRRFADTVAEEATSDDPIVLVQDYHFALLPRMIRERLPRATIVTFWHIPWPNAETFGICPWRDEIIDGLLGSSILGFHTQFHCNNFLEAVDRFMESRIDRERSSVSLAGRETLVRPYPISIEWPPAALEHVGDVAACREAVARRYALPPEARIAVGIERFDYTKGIIERMHAVDELLTRDPVWRGKLVFIQAAAPTRSKLGAYAGLQAEAIRVADDINARHGDGNWKPILLVIRHHVSQEVYELFRAADICIVSSLHDGMNLVAKEFVAARGDGRGVLILSSFAGASSELSEALIVNPYDTHGMARAIETALRMPAAEQGDRMSVMRELVRQRNVYRWAAQMLLDAARLRRRERIRTSSAATLRLAG